MQLYILTCFYVIATIADWSLLELGKSMFIKGNLICTSKNTVTVVNWQGAAYMSYFTVTTLLYALVMWFTFYRIPKKYGMVRSRLMGRQQKLEMINADQSLYIKEENVKTLIVALEEDNKMMQKMSRGEYNY